MFVMMPLLPKKNRSSTVTVTVWILTAALSFLAENGGYCQEPAFELPVQLIGFPVIIMAVRMSNFVRKLAYSLSPSTYRRNIRSAANGVLIPFDDKNNNSNRSIAVDENSIDFDKVENYLVAQLGADVCVDESVCLRHVQMSGLKTGDDWYRVLGQYASLPPKQGQFYLLSLFLGDLIKSPKLCRHFTKVGRNCRVRIYNR